VLYLVWGSTYRVVRIGVQTCPPALFAASRFLLAGLLMLAVALVQGHALPRSARDWASIASMALIGLAPGNGLVTWAEQWIDSGQAALIVATSALWLAGFGALGKRGVPVGASAWAGLVLGLAGVALLVGAGLSLRAGPALAYAMLVVSAVLWATGSIIARRVPVACAPVMNTALQLLTAAAGLWGVGLARGESFPARWDVRGFLSILVLAIFGSCLAYSAYLWLLQNVSPALLGTYAYVNPAVAVLLGSALLGERMGELQWTGTLVILVAVVLVTRGSRTVSRAGASAAREVTD
jgi:drug/metabolite transporter (DMT)-like permease